MGADCKSVAKATEVRILYPPHGARSAPDLGFLGQGLILLSLARSSRIRPSTPFPPDAGCAAWTSATRTSFGARRGSVGTRRSDTSGAAWSWPGPLRVLGRMTAGACAEPVGVGGWWAGLQPTAGGETNS